MQACIFEQGVNNSRMSLTLKQVYLAYSFHHHTLEPCSAIFNRKMGKRGQQKKSCQQCTRRKVRCDIVQRRIEGNECCSACQRRKQECVVVIDQYNSRRAKSINKSTGKIRSDQSTPIVWPELDLELPVPVTHVNTNQDTRASFGSVEMNTISLANFSPLEHTVESSNSSQLSSTSSAVMNTFDIKTLDMPKIQKAFNAFFSSSSLLSRILMHWKPFLQKRLSNLSSFEPMDPIFIFIEAIVCFGITLDRSTAASLLPTKTALVRHLKASLSSFLFDDNTFVQLQQVRDKNAILASCIILLDVWLDTEVYFPNFLLPGGLNNSPPSTSVLRINVVGIECLARITTQIIYEKGVDFSRQEDIGDCAMNLMLYWYVYLIDAFSVMNAERQPFLRKDTVELLEEKLVKQIESSNNSTQLNGSQIQVKKELGIWLLKLDELARIAWQIGSIWTSATFDRENVSRKSIERVMKRLRKWEETVSIVTVNNPCSAVILSTFAFHQDPVQFCATLLHRYCYLKLHEMAKEYSFFDNIDGKYQVTIEQLQSASFKAWQDTWNMMERIEEVMNGQYERHPLLSQSRTMIHGVLECILWSLTELGVGRERRTEEERVTLQFGSDRMLQMLNRYAECDAFLGLDILERISESEQISQGISLCGKV